MLIFLIKREQSCRDVNLSNKFISEDILEGRNYLKIPEIIWAHYFSSMWKNICTRDNEYPKPLDYIPNSFRKSSGEIKLKELGERFCDIKGKRVQKINK